MLREGLPSDVEWNCHMSRAVIPVWIVLAREAARMADVLRMDEVFLPGYGAILSTKRNL